MTQDQIKLLDDLSALRRSVAQAPAVRSILDGGWFETVEHAIRNGSFATPADPSGFLYDFCHPLRGVDWFERNQELVMAGRLNEVSEDGRFAIAFAGLDPLRTMFPLIEKRFAAFTTLPFKQPIVETKLNELRAQIRTGLQEPSVRAERPWRPCPARCPCGY